MGELRKRLKGQQGFTLIELIVVVAILGILAVVLTPKVLGAMDNSKKNSALSTGKQVQLAMERKAVEGTGYPAETDMESIAEIVAALKSYVPLDANDLSTTAGDFSYDLDTSVTPNTYTLELTFKSTGKKLTIKPDSVASN